MKQIRIQVSESLYNKLIDACSVLNIPLNEVVAWKFGDKTYFEEKRAKKTSE